MTAKQFLKLKKGYWSDSVGIMPLPEVIELMESYVKHCQEASKALQFCSCPFVMIMRGEDDKPYCGSCKLLVDEFPDFSTE